MASSKNPFRTVLVTRPAHQAGSLMTALALRGYTPVAAPVLEMHPTDMAIPEGDFDALTFTSANGVAAFAARDPRRDIPVFAVGSATAAAARKAQFHRIVSGEAGAAALAEIISGQLAAGSIVLHPAGRDVAVDLGEALAGSGITVTRVAIYAMEPATALPDAALKAIEAGCAVPLFSARSAASLADLARAAGVSLAKVAAILPPEAKAPDGFGSVAFAPLQNGDEAVIAALDRLESVKRDL